jgi:DNA-binding NarL/FixJ family response regulator
MPELACLMLTSFSDDGALSHAITAGAAGYVPRRTGDRTWSEPSGLSLAGLLVGSVSIPGLLRVRSASDLQSLNGLRARRSSLGW